MTGYNWQKGTDMNVSDMNAPELTARKRCPAIWDVLCNGKPTGLTIGRINASPTRWEWVVLDDATGTVQTSVFHGGYKAALAQLEYEKERLGYLWAQHEMAA